MILIRSGRQFGASAAIVALALFFASGGCTKKYPESAAPLTPGQQLVAHGKRVYQSNCLACHHVNPRSAGSIGPDVHGSSRELLEAKVLNASYPPGYTPKRASKAMPAQPPLKDDLSALHAYLNAP